MTIFIILLIGFFLVWGWQALKNSAKRQERLENARTDIDIQSRVVKEWEDKFKEEMSFVDPDIDLAEYLRSLCIKYQVEWEDDVDIDGTMRKSRLDGDIEETREKIKEEEDDIDFDRCECYDIVATYSYVKNVIFDRILGEDISYKTLCKNNKLVAFTRWKFSSYKILMDDQKGAEAKEITDAFLKLNDEQISSGNKWFFDKYNKAREKVEGHKLRGSVDEYYPPSRSSIFESTFDELELPDELEIIYDPSNRYSRAHYTTEELDKKMSVLTLGTQVPILSLNPPKELLHTNQTIWERIFWSETAYGIYWTNLLMNGVVRKTLYEKYGIKQLATKNANEICAGSREEKRQAALDYMEEKQNKYPYLYNRNKK